MIISTPTAVPSQSGTADAEPAISAEVLAQYAAALGVKIPVDRAQAAAGGTNAVLRTLARRAGTLRMESEPVDYLAATQRTKQR